jgi:hypothetical protein
MIKYEDSPNIIEQIPFPAITINNELVFRRYFKYTKYSWTFRRPPVEELEAFYQDEELSN